MEAKQDRRRQVGDTLAKRFWGPLVAYGIVLRSRDAFVLEGDEEFVRGAIFRHEFAVRVERLISIPF